LSLQVPCQFRINRNQLILLYNIKDQAIRTWQKNSIFSQINQIIGIMKHSTHQQILHICAQLEANSLPISVGLVKAKATSTLPLPAVIKSINAYKGGERAPDSNQPETRNVNTKEAQATATPNDLASLIQMVLQQQDSIDALQKQVAQLQTSLKTTNG
jgi:hypothetical protein